VAIWDGDYDVMQMNGGRVIRHFDDSDAAEEWRRELRRVADERGQKVTTRAVPGEPDYYEAEFADAA
jgi:hypothetical protein